MNKWHQWRRRCRCRYRSMYFLAGREGETKSWGSLGCYWSVLLPTTSLILTSGICCFFLKHCEVNQIHPQNMSAAASKISWKFWLHVEWSIVYMAEEMKLCSLLLWRYYFILTLLLLFWTPCNWCGYISVSFLSGSNPRFGRVMKNPVSCGFLLNQNTERF